MWVVKLGGSLTYSPELLRWLNALTHSDAVIVPGGGPFADAVRQTQNHWGYTDVSAHNMALLGMYQYGLMLADLGGFQHFSKPHQLARHRDQPWVWLPWPEDLAEAEIKPSWDTTSDSLAVWLAQRLSLNRLLLVKSVTTTGEGLGSNRVPPNTVSCTALVNTNMIDPAFPDFFHAASLDAWLCGPADHADLKNALHQPELHFVRIRHA